MVTQIINTTMKTGHIRITDRVYFEPDGIKKPKDYGLDVKAFGIAMRTWIASKQLVEVENVVPHLMPRLNEQKADVYYDVIFSDYNFEQPKDNQPCKAEVIGKTATIIELIK